MKQKSPRYAGENRIVGNGEDINKKTSGDILRMVSQAKLNHRRWSIWTIEVYHMQNENVTSILIANRDVRMFLYSLYFQKIKKITFLKATSCIYY